MKFELGRRQRDAIFPANIMLDHDLRVVALGPSLARRFPEFTIGASLLDHFRPSTSGVDTTIEAVAGSETMISLESLSSDKVLSGWVIPSDGGYFLALRLAPAGYALENSGLQISDFAPGDPAIHALLMFSIQRAVLEEQRLVALELDRARQLSLDLVNRITRAAGFLAHDFNNFLSIIKLNCERLKVKLADQPRPLRLVEIIAGAAARGSAVTRSLMTLSYQRNDTRIPVSIDALIEENLAFFQTTVGAHVRLDLDLGAQGATAMTSPVAALNCLVNLLINARDAMPRGGTVHLSTALLAGDQATGQQIVIEVIDDGEGMPAEVCERAFEPLFSTKSHGNGLGLPSVLEFATDSGGSARIASTPGTGTRVTVSLPCFTPPRVAEIEIVAAETHEPSANATTGSAAEALMPGVLVVEDEPDALEALCELLDSSGFHVTGVSNGQAAVEELARRRFEVLLTDIVLPGESGAQLASKACEMDPALKVVLMSGFVPQGEELKDDWMFVRKPIDARAVTELLRVATRA